MSTLAHTQTELQTILELLIPEGAKVYFQPPEKKDMVYPCITYERDFTRTFHADNRPYKSTKRYQVTVIDENPLSAIPDKVEDLPLTAFVRFYVADNLNHFVYSLYF